MLCEVSILKLDNVVFSYDKKKKVLDNLSVEFKSGKITALLGVNGSGKSTLLKILTGVLIPDRGVIKLDSKVIKYTDNTTYKEILGYMPEFLEMYPDLTVVNLLGFLSKLKFKKEQFTIDYILNLLHLTKYKNMKIKELSKGTKQRLNLAQAILTKPKIAIFDEPSNGFDCVNMNVFYTLIRYLANTGSIVIITSHHLTEIFGKVDFLLLLDSGTIAKQFKCSGFFIEKNNTRSIFIAFYFKNKLTDIFINNLKKIDDSLYKSSDFTLEGKIKKESLHRIINLIANENISLLDMYTRDSTIEDLLFSYD